MTGFTKQKCIYELNIIKTSGRMQMLEWVSFSEKAHRKSNGVTRVWIKGLTLTK